MSIPAMLVWLGLGLAIFVLPAAYILEEIVWWGNEAVAVVTLMILFTIWCLSADPK